VILDQPAFTPGSRSGFRQFVWFWLPVLAYVAAIFAVSSMSSPPNPIHVPNSDKIYHLCEYGLLGVLLGRALRFSVSPYSPLAAVVMTISLVMIVGASDEYYQSFVPGRTCDVFDWLTDTTAGVLSQVLLWRFWAWRRAVRKARA